MGWGEGRGGEVGLNCDLVIIDVCSARSVLNLWKGLLFVCLALASVLCQYLKDF